MFSTPFIEVILNRGLFQCPHQKIGLFFMTSRGDQFLCESYKISNQLFPVFPQYRSFHCVYQYLRPFLSQKLPSLLSHCLPLPIHLILSPISRFCLSLIFFPLGNHVLRFLHRHSLIVHFDSVSSTLSRL